MAQAALMTESQYKKLVAQALRNEGFLVEVIESSTSSGLPDLFYGGVLRTPVVGNEETVVRWYSAGWIETKIAHGRRVRLRHSQVQWMQKAERLGVPTWIAAYYKGVSFVWPGSRAAEVYKMGLDAPGSTVHESALGMLDVLVK